MPVQSTVAGVGHRPVRARSAVIALAAACLLLVAGSFLPHGSSLAVFGSDAQAKCKHNLSNHYKDNYVEVELVTNWCYDGKSVTSRHTRNPPFAHVRGAADAAGLREDGSHWARDSRCYDYHGTKNHNCLIKYQFVFSYTWQVLGPRIGVCLATRIYGNGAHKRARTTNC